MLTSLPRSQVEKRTDRHAAYYKAGCMTENLCNSRANSSIDRKCCSTNKCNHFKFSCNTCNDFYRYPRSAACAVSLRDVLEVQVLRTRTSSTYLISYAYIPAHLLLLRRIINFSPFQHFTSTADPTQIQYLACPMVG